MWRTSTSSWLCFVLFIASWSYQAAMNLIKPIKKLLQQNNLSVAD